LEVAPLERFNVRSDSHEQLKDITQDVNEALRRTGVSEGICQVYVPHTTAGVLVNENADPDVCWDILVWLDKMVPQDGPYRHAEGNSPGHIKSVLVGQSASLPVAGGRLALGVWQGVYLAEFDGPRERTVLVTVVGAG
jgi:secondary thiamine-phosphate synthase enzyme